MATPNEIWRRGQPMSPRSYAIWCAIERRLWPLLRRIWRGSFLAYLLFAASPAPAQVVLNHDYTSNPYNEAPEPGQELKDSWSPHPAFRTVVRLDRPGVILVMGNISVQVEKCSVDDAAIVGVRLAILDGDQWVPVEPPEWPLGTRMNTNVYQGQHYQPFQLAWAIPVEAGRYGVRIETYARGHNGKACRTFYKSRQYNGVTIMGIPSDVL